MERNGEKEERKLGQNRPKLTETITIRLDEKEVLLIKQMAKSKKISVSKMLRGWIDAQYFFYKR